MDLVEWCNSNSGFTSAVLSVVGMTISVIAIFVSIKTALLPYKKKIIISASSGIIPGQSLVYLLTITNLGNRSVYIVKVGFMIGEKIAVKTDCVKDNDEPLLPKQSRVVFLTEEELIEFAEKYKGKTIYAVAEDSEGKKYKTTLMSVSNLLGKCI